MPSLYKTKQPSAFAKAIAASEGPQYNNAWDSWADHAAQFAAYQPDAVAHNNKINKLYNGYINVSKKAYNTKNKAAISAYNKAYYAAKRAAKLAAVNGDGA